jgi:hypothetical protein
VLKIVLPVLWVMVQGECVQASEERKRKIFMFCVLTPFSCNTAGATETAHGTTHRLINLPKFGSAWAIDRVGCSYSVMWWLGLDLA